MEVSVLSFADFAQETLGKLTIVGIFDQINASNLPFKYPFYLVGRFRFAPKEELFKRIVIKVLFEDDGKELYSINGDFNMQKADGEKEVTLNFILNLKDFEFQKEGTYHVAITADNGFYSVLPLKVIHTK